MTARRKLPPVDLYKLVESCVETGVSFGVNRAFKHTDHPTQDVLVDHVVREVMLSLTEHFKFD